MRGSARTSPGSLPGDGSFGGTSQSPSGPCKKDFISQLPLELREIILAKVCADSEGGLEQLSFMRSVSKDWRAAFGAFPGTVKHSISISSKEDVAKLTKMMPGMATLNAQVLLERLKLSPLADLTQLTRVVLAGPSPIGLYGFLVPLDSLPASVVDLELEEANADLRTFTRLRCTALTRLQLKSSKNRPSCDAKLFRRLPKLKVILVMQDAQNMRLQTLICSHLILNSVELFTYR